MRKITFLLGLYLFMALGSYAQNINRIEYFFNTDPGFGNATSVAFTPGNNVQDVQFAANTASLAPGFHTLHIRSQDTNGKWSIVANTIIYKDLVNAVTTSNISGIEYFFNIDPGFGNGTSVAFTPGANVQDVQFTANTAGLAPGFHTLHIRSQDTNGKWSIVANTIIYKDVVNAVTQPNISRIEYFIDTDPGVGQATAIPFTASDNVADLAATIDLSGLANGGHYFFVRSMAVDGKYSITNSKYFEIDNALPLTLLGYNAVLTGNMVKSTWQTANEVNTSHFIIERSVNGIDFMPVGKVGAKNTIGQHNYYHGNHLTAQLTGQTLYYRLQQVDIDGKNSYSKIVPVKVGTTREVTISPNPTTDVVTIFAPKAKSVAIVSIQGVVVYGANLNSAWDSTTISLGHLPKGTYLIKLVGEDNTITTEKVLVK